MNHYPHTTVCIRREEQREKERKKERILVTVEEWTGTPRTEQAASHTWGHSVKMEQNFQQK